MQEYKICSRCVMDTSSDPNIIIDENGICNYCLHFDELKDKYWIQGEEGRKILDETISRIKRDGKGKEYDCILGLSGGVDSSYLAYLAKKFDLRVLAVHADAGWNSEIAVQNIKKMCKKLNYDLHTVVIDWPTMKEVQRAFMYSGLANLDIPQDHAFVAAVYDMAKKYKIKYILNGGNVATEGILSTAYQYTAMDYKHIKGVYHKFGRGKSLKKYPHFTYLDLHFLLPKVYKIELIRMLHYVDYSKKEAMATLTREFDWQYYGGKHYESRFTKFFQEYYLPYKFGWDKRRDHISSLIVGGELTREEGLLELQSPVSTPDEIENEKDYVIKKLDITNEDWEKIMLSPTKTEDDYPSSKKMRERYLKLKNFMKRKAL